MRSFRLPIRFAIILALSTIAVPWAAVVVSGQAKKTDPGASDRTITVIDAAGRKHTRVRPITLAERKAAAARLKAKREAAAAAARGADEAALAAGVIRPRASALAIGPISDLLVGADGQLIPDYSGVTPNYANSPAPLLRTVIDPVTGQALPEISPDTGLPMALSGGIRKFVDGLPGLGAAKANARGQYIPVAVPDTTTYADADYYEIELIEYSEQMHADLPPTRLRGYRQTNMGGTPVHYLGPLISARRGRPVRITFTNNLTPGAAGNLFLPVDTSIMGAGPGPLAAPGTPELTCRKGADGLVPANCYAENRATIHLHGGVTPWISDGTTHQWITPAGETTAYPEGVSVYNVPDMPNPGKPGSPTNPSRSGRQTFYYTNDQSARLMFYHDHAMGITRLNVYAGEAAGYLLTDAVEQDLIAGGVIPSEQIPLIIQDKTFVDPATIRTQDPTWNWGTGTTFTPYTDPKGETIQLRDPKAGDLWWPHVYMPAQNPYDLSGLNAMGRWHYGPWFWPPVLIPYGPVPNPYYDCNAFGQADPTHPCTRPWQPVEVPGVPQPSWGAEAFLDTPVVNGTAYPTLTVQPRAYRFRILDAAHDRFFNLQWYIAADKTAATTAEFAGVTRMCDGSVALGNCTEVKMVPASPATPGLPESWPKDGRAGGVPDPAQAGPSFIQIGTEGGFLPMPVIVPNQPISWNLNPTTFNFGNVESHALLVGPAERADVIVDFSAYAGKTLILYNDAPAAFPALDPRNDYYTGAPDLRDEGGVFTPLPGYGPNIRTIMQVHVAAGGGTPFDVDALMAAWAPSTIPDPANPSGPPIAVAGVFQRGQDPIIVGQSAYDQTYDTTFPTNYPAWGVARIQDAAMTFQTTEGAFATLDFKPKAIHDEMGATFDDYGRMSAKLGLELPNPSAFTANFVMQGYADPPTELVKLSNQLTPIGTPGADGTQIWKITHNGVDTHPIHFHLFHVQLINRVGWDGAIRLPDANELGWKDTLRISPLEDTIVALRPIAPDPAALPWTLPNSIRPLNPTLPLGSSIGFSGKDPLGNNVTVFNDMANFGWEYVWHCHILSHEENDMMRAVVFAVPPAAPLNLTASVIGSGGTRRVVLVWTDPGSTTSNKTGFTVQRATDPDFLTGLVSTPLGIVTTYTDVIGASTTPYFYRVAASNTVGSTITGFPTITADSAFSNVAAVNGLAAPTLLTAALQSGGRVLLTFRDNATNETGFVVERSTTGPTGFVPLVTLPARAGTGNVTYTDGATVPASVNVYRVKAINGAVSSGYSNTASVAVPANVIVPDVVSMTQAAATAAITGAGLTVTITSAPSATVPPGSVISQNPAGGTSVPPGSAVTLVISLGSSAGPTAVAAVTAANGRGNRTLVITTGVPTRLVAFVSVDGPQATGAAGQAATVSGGGLAWTLVARANAQWGDAEIWTADAPAALAGVTLTSTLLRHRAPSDYLHLFRVVAFTGVGSIGASNVASGQTVATATVGLVAEAGSIAYAVGEDWSNAATRTVAAGQVVDVQRLGADGDTFWVQRLTAPAATAGAVTFTATTVPQPAPGDRWNFAIVELRR
jgi:FtsP/CotA-like multicopper oxidase with cupredoxin domain